MNQDDETCLMCCDPLSGSFSDVGIIVLARKN